MNNLLFTHRNEKQKKVPKQNNPSLAVLRWMVALPLDRDPDKQSERSQTASFPSHPGRHPPVPFWHNLEGGPKWGYVADICLSSNRRRSMNLAPSSSLFGLL